MKKIIVLTGAGMSAESGISTFRDSGGLWEKYEINDVATPNGWRRNQALVLDFYNQRRRQLLDSKPNEAHYALAELEKDYDVQIVTQNVDNLHERAGSTNVVHLHGELMKVRSTGPGEEVFDVDPNHPDINTGDYCPKGFQLRPHIVWFGEAVPEIEKAERMAASAALFLIIGTSMQVYPAAGLINSVKSGVPVYLIDPHEVNHLQNDITVIQKGASDGMKEFIKRLRNLNF
jgi:NAD-dependent deacetylase